MSIELGLEPRVTQLRSPRSFHHTALVYPNYAHSSYGGQKAVLETKSNTIIAYAYMYFLCTICTYVPVPETFLST